MFGNERSRKRHLITVTPAQAEALHYFTEHYAELEALLTLSHNEIVYATSIEGGYETEGSE